MRKEYLLKLEIMSTTDGFSNMQIKCHNNTEFCTWQTNLFLYRTWPQKLALKLLTWTWMLHTCTWKHVGAFTFAPPVRQGNRKMDSGQQFQNCQRLRTRPDYMVLLVLPLLSILSFFNPENIRRYHQSQLLYTLSFHERSLGPVQKLTRKYSACLEAVWIFCNLLSLEPNPATFCELL